MLTTVEVYTSRGESLALPLQDLNSGYRLQDIQGLDPVKATLVSSSFAQMDGETFHAASRGTRDIILKLGIEPNYENNSVRDLRLRLYRFFMPKSEVRLRLYFAGETPVEIVGRVEDFDFPLFTQEPQVSITMLCFDPDFYSVTPKQISGTTVSNDTDKIIDYEGTVDVGVVFRLAINRAITEIELLNNPGDIQQSMSIVQPFAAGDVLEISTIPGAKRAVRIRGGVQTSVLYGVSPSASWIRLAPGTNRFRASVSGAAIPYTISYKAKYGGM